LQSAPGMAILFPELPWVSEAGPEMPHILPSASHALPTAGLVGRALRRLENRNPLK